MAKRRGSDAEQSRIGVRRRCKKNSPSVLSCMGKRTREGCDRGSEVGTVRDIALTSRHLNVVVRSPPLLRKVGWNGKTTSPRGPTIRSPPIAWIQFPRQVRQKTKNVGIHTDTTFPCLIFSIKRIVWRTSRQVHLLCPWARHLTVLPLNFCSSNRWQLDSKTEKVSSLLLVNVSYRYWMNLLFRRFFQANYFFFQ